MEAEKYCNLYRDPEMFSRCKQQRFYTKSGLDYSEEVDTESSIDSPIDFVNKDYLNFRNVSRISSRDCKVGFVIHVAASRASAPISTISSKW